MQKVEGSSPFIRSSEPAGNGGFLVSKVRHNQRNRGAGQHWGQRLSELGLIRDAPTRGEPLATRRGGVSGLVPLSSSNRRFAGGSRELVERLELVRLAQKETGAGPSGEAHRQSVAARTSRPGRRSERPWSRFRGIPVRLMCGVGARAPSRSRVRVAQVRTGKHGRTA
jgi:hypothetical protein